MVKSNPLFAKDPALEEQVVVHRSGRPGYECLVRGPEKGEFHRDVNQHDPGEKTQEFSDFTRISADSD